MFHATLLLIMRNDLQVDVATLFFNNVNGADRIEVFAAGSALKMSIYADTEAGREYTARLLAQASATFSTKHPQAAAAAAAGKLRMATEGYGDIACTPDGDCSIYAVLADLQKPDGPSLLWMTPYVRRLVGAEVRRKYTEDVGGRKGVIDVLFSTGGSDIFADAAGTPFETVLAYFAYMDQDGHSFDQIYLEVLFEFQENVVLAAP